MFDYDNLIGGRGCGVSCTPHPGTGPTRLCIRAVLEEKDHEYQRSGPNLARAYQAGSHLPRGGNVRRDHRSASSHGESRLADQFHNQPRRRKLIVSCRSAVLRSSFGTSTMRGKVLSNGSHTISLRSFPLRSELV